MADEDRAHSERLLTSAEIAELFRIDAASVTRWARAGKLTSVRRLGRRRYRASEIRILLDVEMGAVPPGPDPGVEDDPLPDRAND